MRCRSGTWLWLLALAHAWCLGGSGGQELGTAPWLDKRMRRFCSPLPLTDPYAPERVVSDFIRQARERISLECWRREEGKDQTPRAGPVPKLSMRLASPTPRRILSEIVARWSQFSPLTVVREREFLCLAERALLDDPTWPLNAEHVEGFKHEALYFGEICDEVERRIQKSHSARVPERDRWRPMSCDRDENTMFGPCEGPDDMMAVEIRSGSARDVLCQVAMLLPDCFWGVVAKRGEDGAKGWTLLFGGWSNVREKPTEELVAMLKRDAPLPRGISRFHVVYEIWNELNVRGPEAVRVMGEAYRTTDDAEFKERLLWDMLRISTWKDNDGAVSAFAASQLRSGAHPELASLLEVLAARKMPGPRQNGADTKRTTKESLWAKPWAIWGSAALVAAIATLALALALRKTKRW